MTFDQALQVLFGAAILAIGWFARVLYSAVNSLRKDLSDLQIHIAEKYIPKEDFNRLADEIKNLLNNIVDKLDKKADK